MLTRHPHAPAAIGLLEHVARKDLGGLIGATTVTTIHCLATKAVGTASARRHITTLLDLFEVAAVTRVVLADALQLAFRDYEDAVLHEAARHAGADAIATRDPKGFAGSGLRIYAPEELLRLVGATPSG